MVSAHITMTAVASTQRFPIWLLFKAETIWSLYLDGPDVVEIIDWKSHATTHQPQLHTQKSRMASVEHWMVETLCTHIMGIPISAIVSSFVPIDQIVADTPGLDITTACFGIKVT